MQSHELTTNNPHDTLVPLLHVANLLAHQVHDFVEVGLFETNKEVHHLHLSLNNQRGLANDLVEWVLGCDNPIRVGGLLENGVELQRFISVIQGISQWVSLIVMIVVVGIGGVGEPLRLPLLVVAMLLVVFPDLFGRDFAGDPGILAR